MSEKDQLPEFLKLLVSDDSLSGCWPWKGKIRDDGYGVISSLAHRLVFSLLRGSIPEGLVLDHLCRNHACVNPAHLEAVTNAENVLRGKGWAAKHIRKTHCPKGHPLSGDNLYVFMSKNGNPGRHCIACRNQRKKEHYHRTKSPPKPKVERTHCKKGHELTPANQYLWVSSRGKKFVYCLKCRNDYRAEKNKGR